MMILMCIVNVPILVNLGAFVTVYQGNKIELY